MLSPDVLARMVMELLQKYNLRGTLRSRLARAELQKIRPVYRTTVALWQRGEEMTSFFGNDEGLLKSHRRIIKAEYGIDILYRIRAQSTCRWSLAMFFAPRILCPYRLKSAQTSRCSTRLTCRQNGETTAATQRITSVSSVYLNPYKLDDDLPAANTDKLKS